MLHVVSATPAVKGRVTVTNQRVPFILGVRLTKDWGEQLGTSKNEQRMISYCFEINKCILEMPKNFC